VGRPKSEFPPVFALLPVMSLPNDVCLQNILLLSYNEIWKDIALFFDFNVVDL
jgi:hypothetical protein